MLEMSRNIVRKKHEELITKKKFRNCGHASLYRIEIVVDVLNGLIIDHEILSKYCPEYTAAKRNLGMNSAEFFIWFEGHKTKCKENYVSFSNSMEMKAAEILWKRSVNACGLKYVNILSDGDAKTYQHP
jgi:hypothetical protein